MNTAKVSPDEQTSDKVWDSVVIGGGAAGLSAGVVLARARFTVQVVGNQSPRNAPAAHLHGYLTRDGMSPRDFIATGQEELARYGASMVQATVTGAERDSDGSFVLSLDDAGSMRAKSLLVATGLSDELPDIPGLAEGWARAVHHCPHCHGYEESDRHIVVLGSMTGSASAHLAALMRRHSASVTFCVNGVDLGQAERKRLMAYGVRVIDARVDRVSTRALSSDGPSVTVELATGEALTCEAIFVAPRLVPHDAILLQLGARTDPVTGLVAVDGSGATSVDGLWAAGNVVNPRAQLITAAGAGCAAGIAMSSWLLGHELFGSAAHPGGAGQ